MAGPGPGPIPAGRAQVARPAAVRTTFRVIEGLDAALAIHWDASGIRRLAFLPVHEAGPAGPHPWPALDAWLRAYGAHPQSPPPSLPLAPRGTPFQRRVWAALRAIPAGETRTYGALARALDSGPRAVAGACRANPWVLLVPCHRAVARSGPGGFMGHRSGWGLALKGRLLRHEGGR